MSATRQCGIFDQAFRREEDEEEEEETHYQGSEDDSEPEEIPRRFATTQPIRPRPKLTHTTKLHNFRQTITVEVEDDEDDPLQRIDDENQGSMDSLYVPQLPSRSTEQPNHQRSIIQQYYARPEQAAGFGPGSSPPPHQQCKRKRRRPPVHNPEHKMVNTFLGTAPDDPTRCFGCLSAVTSYVATSAHTKIKEMINLYYTTTQISIVNRCQMISDFYEKHIRQPNNTELRRAVQDAHNEELRRKLLESYKFLPAWTPKQVYYHFDCHALNSTNTQLNLYRKVLEMLRTMDDKGLYKPASDAEDDDEEEEEEEVEEEDEEGSEGSEEESTRKRTRKINPTNIQRKRVALDMPGVKTYMALITTAMSLQKHPPAGPFSDNPEIANSTSRNFSQGPLAFDGPQAAGGTAVINPDWSRVQYGSIFPRR